MIFKILSVILKIITVYIYSCDLIKTKKLANENYCIRETYWYQKIEITFFCVLAYCQVLIPLTVYKPYISTLLELLIMITTYIHLNRWLYIGRKAFICRDELFNQSRVVNITYQKNILRFRSKNRQFAIHHPLVTKELIKKYM